MNSKTRRTLQLLRGLVKVPTFDDDAANVYAPDFSNLWHRLHAEYTFGGELHPHGAGQQALWQANAEQEPPEWWPWWLKNFELEEALEVGHLYHDDNWDGVTGPWMQWALEHGIAPGQLFCMRVERPTVYQSSYEYNEYDVNHCVEVLEVCPLPPALAARRWMRFLRNSAKYRQLFLKAQQEHTAQIERAVGHMYLYETLYSPNRDAFGGPYGVSLRLQTDLRLWPRAAAAGSVGTTGSDDGGKREAALKRLIEKACKINPYLSPELIQEMEIRR